ncbi:diacylglycerol/lipid kinase family protein [Indioceanicola profundi]|uniref:diacylglycerol/lipid kinase family protein n=1 Tax=Indioceanicola profundi TaxID=2220096 RepID=UPI000E6AC694|nr:diacylglycerol kinase family protein [Indioceanicola profundi]
MKLSVVLNSSAGSLLDRPPEEAVREVEEAFEAAGHRVVCTAVPAHDIQKALEQARDGDADVVVVGGGDGTIASAAHILTGSGKALGVLPLGTMNLLARDLGIPFDIKEAARALAAGRIEPIDMAEMNGRPFLNNSALGLYPRMVRERERERKRHGLSKWPAMTLAFIHTLLDYQRFEVTLVLDDGPRRLVTPFLAIANNQYDEGLGPILRRASLTDGILAIYASRHRARWRVLKLIAQIMMGNWRGDPDLEVYRTTEATVFRNRRKVRVANDGELLEVETPLHYRILPGALKVLRPGSVQQDAEPAEPGRVAAPT